MKMTNELYSIGDISMSDGDSHTANVEINPGHPVFEGHFPGNPILPGVIILEILKDLLRKKNGHNYILKYAKTIKYLLPLDPRKQTLLKFTIKMSTSEDELTVSAYSSFQNDEINFKFQGIFVQAE